MLVIVTGASRGLGRAIANAFVSEDTLKSSMKRIVLVARSENGLEETRQMLLSKLPATSAVDVNCYAMDLSNLEQLDSHLDQLMSTVSAPLFERIVLINNAGSLGHIGPCTSYPSLQAMKAAVDLNVTSSLWLSTRFVQHVTKQLQSASTTKSTEVTLVNISSLVAIEAFPTMGIYSAGKAARDQYHQVMAKELVVSDDTFKILNYAPGPLETEMTEEIRKSSQLDTSLRPAFDKKLIDPNDSAAKLVQLLINNQFTSGQHIDYYDLL